MSRSYLLVPRVRSSNINIVSTTKNLCAQRLYNIIEGSNIKAKTDRSAPSNFHRLRSEIISPMLVYIFGGFSTIVGAVARRTHEIGKKDKEFGRCLEIGLTTGEHFENGTIQRL